MIGSHTETPDLIVGASPQRGRCLDFHPNHRGRAFRPTRSLALGDKMTHPKRPILSRDVVSQRSTQSPRSVKSWLCPQPLRSGTQAENAKACLWMPWPWIPYRSESPAAESPIGPEDPTSNLSTYDVWTLVAPFADSGRATRCYPVDSSRTS
jgi:hypothetical protein